MTDKPTLGDWLKSLSFIALCGMTIAATFKIAALEQRILYLENVVQQKVLRTLSEAN